MTEARAFCILAAAVFVVSCVCYRKKREQAEDWLARNAGPNSKFVFLHQHREA